LCPVAFTIPCLKSREGERGDVVLLPWHAKWHGRQGDGGRSTGNELSVTDWLRNPPWKIGLPKGREIGRSSRIARDIQKSAAARPSVCGSVYSAIAAGRAKERLDSVLPSSGPVVRDTCVPIQGCMCGAALLFVETTTHTHTQVPPIQRGLQNESEERI
jgi:hypothetical protein